MGYPRIILNYRGGEHMTENTKLRNSSRPEEKKTWVKPEITELLPVEDTEHHASTGSDGGGPFTHS